METLVDQPMHDAQLSAVHANLEKCCRRDYKCCIPLKAVEFLWLVQLQRWAYVVALSDESRSEAVGAVCRLDDDRTNLCMSVIAVSQG